MLNADVIRFIRNSRKLSQSSFAQKINVSQSYVTKLEGGERRLTERVEQRIKEVFGITDEKLIATKHLITELKS